ncbi:hypothetical protein ACIO3O_39030 [Streptomyces sp. NPDC087440]|uniref:hypothetical protein n=1 Tax=Streptomyces sp. NPDC087440 TaxID=3365790 RepID=UPI00381C1D5D
MGRSEVSAGSRSPPVRGLRRFDAVLLAGTPLPGADAYGVRDAKADERAGGPTDPHVLLLVSEAYRHGKAIGGRAGAAPVLEASEVSELAPGVVLGGSGPAVREEITGLLSQHRVRERFPAAL